MFFLLYVPIVSKLLPPEALDEMAAHVADKILQIGSNNEEATPEHRQELQRQLLEMMRAAQQEEPVGTELVGIEADGFETDEPPADGSDAFVRLAPARDFLERCLKKSA